MGFMARNPKDPLRVEETTTDTQSWSVVPAGAVDVYTAPLLNERLDRLIDDGAVLIVLHLHDVDFMDSSGLRVILAASKRIADNGGQLFIEGASGAVQRVLEITDTIEQLRRPV